MNRIALSLALNDTDATLEALHAQCNRIGLAEVSLDLMDSFDLSRIIRESPCPLVITYRPIREGGQYQGNEVDRLAVLTEAMRLNGAYVDVEWDSVATLKRPPSSQSKVIVSRHWFGDTPADIWQEFENLRPSADIVKLATTPKQAADVLRVIDLLMHAPMPTIAMSMGKLGTLSRLLAPCFANSLLTFACLNERAATAPGQFTLDEMTRKYHLDQAGPHTKIHVHLGIDNRSRDASSIPASTDNGHTLHVPWSVPKHQLAELLHWASDVPRIQLHPPALTSQIPIRIETELHTLSH